MLETAASTKGFDAIFESRTLFQILANEGFGRWAWHVRSGEVFWCRKVHDIFSIAEFDNRIETFQQRICPDHLERVSRNLGVSVRDGSEIRDYFRIRSDDGSYRLVYNAGRIVKDRRGKLKTIIGLVRACYPHELELGEQAALAPKSITQRRSVHDDPDRLKARLARAIGSTSAVDLRRAEVAFLEFILMRTNGRDEARTLARGLLATFGSAAAAINADPKQILKVQGAGQEHADLFEIISLGSKAILKPRGMPVTFQTSEDLIFYLRSVQVYSQHEQFRVLFMNNANHITNDEVLSEGTVNFVPVNVKMVVRRALDLNSRAVVLVHNHPSGDSKPSLADIEATRRLDDALKVFDIRVFDHIVVSRFGECSFRSLGLLN